MMQDLQRIMLQTIGICFLKGTWAIWIKRIGENYAYTLTYILKTISKESYLQFNTSLLAKPPFIVLPHPC